MYEFKYDTLRTLENTDRKDKRNLVKVVDERKIKRILKSVVGKRIITLSDAGFSEEGVQGRFWGGILNKSEFYGRGKSANAHLWFKGAGFALGLNDVYDIMLVDSLKENKENPLFEDLRIFHFYESAANESESSEILHVDPYLAYLAIRDRGRIISTSQQLTKIEKAKLGYNNYQHTSYE